MNIYKEFEEKFPFVLLQINKEYSDLDYKSGENEVIKSFLKEKILQVLDEAIGEELIYNKPFDDFNEDTIIGYNKKVQELIELKKKYEGCNHEWRPIISEELLKKGYGSEAAQIGQKCIKCNKEV